MGDATRGFASSGETLFVNPAGIAATTRFNIDFTGFLEPAYDTSVFGVAAVDSKLNAEETVAVAGAFGYTYYRSGTDEAVRKGSVVSLGLGLPLADFVFVGATGRYLKLSGAVESSAATLDVGTLVRPFPNLGLAAVAQNLIDIQNPEARRAYAFGAAFGTDLDYHLAFDVTLDFDTNGRAVPSYHAGAEAVLLGMVIPRVGFVEDRFRPARYLTSGASVILQRTAALDVMYRHELTGSGRGFGLSLRLLDSPF
jgi:hypothetical protein